MPVTCNPSIQEIKDVNPRTAGLAIRFLPHNLGREREAGRQAGRYRIWLIVRGKYI